MRVYMHSPVLVCVYICIYALTCACMRAYMHSPIVICTHLVLTWCCWWRTLGGRVGGHAQDQW
ncbi:hypothetical protein C8Q73DRAFT_693605 [Cubamyces lactineus]|nr:hypothetical protein C8Q73DRAFT_693605 [Cubamyces lactineus]